MSCVDSAIIKAMTSDYAPAEHTHNTIGNHLTVDESLDVKQNIICGNSQIASDSISTNNINCGNGYFGGQVSCGQDFEHYYDIALNCKGALSIINPEVENTPTVRLMSTVNGVYIQGNDGKNAYVDWSQTITHFTNVQGAIGTFAEATGDIYDGYTKIDNIDCICRVKQATTLNARIVGVIVDKDKFASHGDCLVKIVPGAYNIGDILVPDASGFARKATDEELVYMMTHAIPRPKITSLETGIDGMAACFIV